MVAAAMTHRERAVMVMAMKEIGGTFVQAMAHAFACANPGNCQRLADAFPELVHEYGPGSLPFAAMLRKQSEPTGA